MAFFFTCEQFPLLKVVSLDDQQHCSWFSQKAWGQIPYFKSDIHDAPISITPATAPVNKPTSKTQTHPDQASWAPLIKSQMESCFFLTIYLCRIRSLAMSLCQSIVWKSSYCPIPGISSESAETVITKNKLIKLTFYSRKKKKKSNQIFWNIWLVKILPFLATRVEGCRTYHASLRT